MQITTRAPDPSKWLSGTAANGTVRAFKCKPEACSDPTTVMFTFQKGSFTPPSPAALEKFATVDLPKSIRAAAAARAVMNGVVERIETLASAPTVLKNYPSVVNETKYHPQRNLVGLCRHRHHLCRPDYNQGRIAVAEPRLAKKSLNEFVDVMKIVEVPVPAKPVPGAPRLPKTESL